MIKSNPILSAWVTHKLEKNNAREVLPLLWRFWTPHQASHTEDPTKGLGIPRKSDLEGHQDLITGLPQDLGKQRLQSCRAQTNLVHTKPQRKGAVTPQKTEPKLSAGVGGFSERCGLAGAHHREIASLVAQTVENLPPMQETWSRKFFGEGNGKYSCLENSMERGAKQATVHGVTNSWIRLNNSLSLFTTGVEALAAALLEGHLEVTVNRTIEPKGPRAGPPQAKQQPGREGHPTRQQSIRLQLYWVRLCPPEQGPVFPTADPHHEAYTSLLVSSIKGQTEKARKSTILQWLEKNHITVRG